MINSCNRIHLWYRYLWASSLTIVLPVILQAASMIMPKGLGAVLEAEEALSEEGALAPLV